MRNIKTYENWISDIRDKFRYHFKYKVGDYILTKYKVWDNISHPRFAKILKQIRYPISGPDGYVYTEKYLVQLSNAQETKIDIHQDDIERKLTPDEIEQFEMEINAIKYNL